ncbi:MAG: hypothetical protein AB1942_08775 [Pseudomonadota bacterium]
MVTTVLEQVGMRLWPLALGVIACTCWGTIAAAQAMPATPTDGKRDFSGSLSLRGLYDSNFARSDVATAAQRGIARQDYSLSPSVNLKIVQPLGQQLVYVNGSAGYNFYRENDQLNRGRADVQGGYMTRLGPCALFANGVYAAAQSDLSTLDAPTVKNLLQTSTVAAGAQCGRGGLSGGISAQRTSTKNSAAIQDDADSDTQAVSVSLGYGNQTLGQFGVSYAYSSSEFPNVILPGRPIGDGFFSESLSLTAQKRFGSKLTTRGSVGRTKVKREFVPPGGELKFNSTNYMLGVDYLLGSRLTLALSADRAVLPSGRAGKLYDIRTGARFSGSYKLGSRFVVGFGHSYDDINSNADTSLPGLKVITDSQTHSSFASIRYRQNENASIALDVRYDDRSANLKEFNYTAMRVGVTAEVGF